MRKRIGTSFSFSIGAKNLLGNGIKSMEFLLERYRLGDHRGLVSLKGCEGLGLVLAPFERVFRSLAPADATQGEIDGSRARSN